MFLPYLLDQLEVKANEVGLLSINSETTELRGVLRQRDSEKLNPLFELY